MIKKNRFIAGNLVGTLVVLVSLIIFILVGVEAFSVDGNDSIATGIGKKNWVGVFSVTYNEGSSLEAIAGAGAIVNDKLQGERGQIEALVARFSKFTEKIGDNVNAIELEVK